MVWKLNKNIRRFFVLQVALLCVLIGLQSTQAIRRHGVVHPTQNIELSDNSTINLYSGVNKIQIDPGSLGFDEDRVQIAFHYYDKTAQRGKSRPRIIGKSSKALSELDNADGLIFTIEIPETSKTEVINIKTFSKDKKIVGRYRLIIDVAHCSKSFEPVCAEYSNNCENSSDPSCIPTYTQTEQNSCYAERNHAIRYFDGECASR